MTREILFRGKRVDNGEWVKGYLICPEFDKSRAYIGYLFPDDDHDLDVAEVASSTVGRFTGLTDKNGVKIFEGDIVHVKAHSGSFTGCVTYWLEEEPRFVCKTKHGLHYAICAKFEFEVLGNIYDNPKLLEVNESD
jgi:uncharacterized phage protein (TIGR01671 family)